MCSYGRPKGLMALLFYFIFFNFSLFLQHSPGACRAPQRGWWPCHFILFYFILSLFLQHAPGARRAPPRGWWPCYFI